MRPVHADHRPAHQPRARQPAPVVAPAPGRQRPRPRQQAPTQRRRREGLVVVRRRVLHLGTGQLRDRLPPKPASGRCAGRRLRARHRLLAERRAHPGQRPPGRLQVAPAPAAAAPPAPPAPAPRSPSTVTRSTGAGSSIPVSRRCSSSVQPARLTRPRRRRRLDRVRTVGAWSSSISTCRAASASPSAASRCKQPVEPRPHRKQQPLAVIVGRLELEALATGSGGSSAAAAAPPRDNAPAPAPPPRRSAPAAPPAAASRARQVVDPQLPQAVQKTRWQIEPRQRHLGRQRRSSSGRRAPAPRGPPAPARARGGDETRPPAPP
jgi:hypothetical protein